MYAADATTRARIPAHVIEQALRQSPASCLLPFSYLRSRVTVNMPKATSTTARATLKAIEKA